MQLTRLYRLWCGLLFIFGFTGCNHLLYPAARAPYISKKFLAPIPEDLSIPVSTNGQLHAWYFPAQSEIKKGLVVHFHGNGENLTTHFNFFRWVTNFGFDYIIFDYRGYGQSSDERASQEKTVQDGIAVFDYIHKNFKPKKLVAVGQSLGSNVLVRTLQDMEPSQRPDMVVLDSSFTSYRAASRSALSQKWFLYPIIPLTYLVIDDDFSAAAQYQKTPAIPAIFYHGTSDTLIKKENGIENYEMWPGVKVLVLNEGGTHTSAFGDRRFVSANKEIFLNCFSYVEKAHFADFSKCAK